MNKRQAVEFYERIGGREGLAERAMQICKEIVESGSYKRAIAGAGQLKVIAEISAKSDTYWAEIAARGTSSETFYATHPKSIPPILASDGRLSREHFEAEKEAGII